MLFHPPEEVHANYWHEAGRSFMIELGANWIARLPDRWRVLDGSVDFESGWALALATRLYAEFRNPDELIALSVEGLVLELLAETARRERGAVLEKAPKWLHEATALLHDRFADSPSLDEVAAAVGVQPSHLVRVFRQNQHCTPGDYVRRLRLEYACRELAASDTPLVTIALAAGFADQTHFCACFKRHIGTSPGAYRKRFRPR